MAFSEAQVKKLEAKLDSKHVKTKQVQDTSLNYVEGWHVIAEANRIFGYDAWDRQTLSTRCVWSGTTSRQYAAAYTAKVRISVRAGAITITREGCGSGESKAFSAGEAHEVALKAAETDATKRALATFGNPFGLALYDRELAGVRNRKVLKSATLSPDHPQVWLLRVGEVSTSFEKPEEFIQALKRAMTEAGNIESLFSMWEQNLDTVRALNRSLKRLADGSSPAQGLVAHLKQCAIKLTKPNDPNEGRALSPSDLNQQRPKIDKSVLALSEPKRLRSKEHLRFVARQPCLICGRTPSQAHHVRYAQPRGLALKVSDEFTVPLCSIHHSENHTTGDERHWWEERKIDPLAVAQLLWQESLGRERSAVMP